MCEEHRMRMRRVALEMAESPRLLYNQRSDTRRAKGDQRRPFAPQKRVKNVRRCSFVGCYEHAQPGTPFCHAHADTPIYD